MSESEDDVMSQATYDVTIAGSADGGDRVPDLSPREARERWLNKLRVDKSDATVSAYHYRLKHFVEWCEDQQIATVRELTGWDIESYETHRRQQGLAPITLSNELDTLRRLFEYCARIEVADESLPAKVEKPDVDVTDEVSDDALDASDAKRLLDYYANSEGVYGTRGHVLIALEWYTGARMGAIRSLDMKDYDRENQSLRFQHIPDEDTPLKNGSDGERIVGVRENVCDILDEYIRSHRQDSYDEYGRQPLVTSSLGRASTSSIRTWTYMATVPCQYRDCPHGKERESCEYLDYSAISKCPSSLGPHAIRSGSLTWQLNQGIPPEVVSERANVSLATLKKHYDQQTQEQELENRRRQYLDRLSFDNGGDTQ
jgi:site-specific recombinase XerD